MAHLAVASRQGPRSRLAIAARTDCWITDCLDTARLNAGQQRRISETYLPVIDRLGLRIPNMEPTPTGENSIVREAREGHLERLSRECVSRACYKLVAATR